MIDNAWGNYLSEVIPDGASDIQVQESRRAFYAGARSLLTILLVLLEPGTEPTKVDLMLMDRVKAELDSFAEAVRTGRA